MATITITLPDDLADQAEQLEAWGLSSPDAFETYIRYKLQVTLPPRPSRTPEEAFADLLEFGDNHTLGDTEPKEFMAEAHR